MPYQPIDYGTDYYPTGDELADIKKPSTTYDNSNLTIGQEKTRQLENAGLSRSADNKAVNPQRNIASSTSQNRIKFNASNLLNKVAGVEQFNPYTTSQPKPQAIATQTKPQSPSWSDDVARQKEFNKLALQRSQGLSAGELEANINRVKQYEPLANNEANRAYGNKLAIEFPYEKYRTETSAARESMGDTLRTMPSFLNRNTAVKPQQYVSF